MVVVVGVAVDVVVVGCLVVLFASEINARGWLEILISH